MADSGALSTPQTLPNPQQPVHGVAGSRGAFFLRATPKPFTYVAANQSNQDFQIAGVVPFERVQVALKSRVYQRALPGGTEKASSSSVLLTVSIATAGVATKTSSAAVPLVVSIATTSVSSKAGSVSLPLVVAFATGSEGGLTLDPEAGDTLTLTAESGDGLTLTSESSDSLDLTPET